MDNSITLLSRKEYFHIDCYVVKPVAYNHAGAKLFRRSVTKQYKKDKKTANHSRRSQFHKVNEFMKILLIPLSN